MEKNFNDMKIKSPKGVKNVKDKRDYNSDEKIKNKNFSVDLNSNVQKQQDDPECKN
jgi:hypothetical protein